MTSPLRDPARRHAFGSRGRATPYRLLVLGVDVPDLVSHAGGLVYDSVRAGLAVEICLETFDDDRALRILGAGARVLPDAFDVEHWPDAVYFAAELHERNPRVRRLVTDAARRHSADVVAWGGAQWLAAGPRLEVAHRLSSAAQVFKLHALLAVGDTAQISPVEPFHSDQRPATDALPIPCH